MKTLVLALLAGIALSPTASAMAGGAVETAVEMPVISSVVTVPQAASLGCSSVSSFKDSAPISSDVDASVQKEPRCYIVVTNTGPDGTVIILITEIPCPRN